MLTKLFTYACLFLILFGLSASDSTTYARELKIGFFEGGSYPTHNLLRDEYLKQLRTIVDDSIRIVTIPQGYRSADWNRTSSKTMARELAHLRQLDMVMAFGPWVVYDLLEAGFDKPIIAMHQYDVKLEGLLTEANRPVADNLVLMWQPEQLKRDLSILSRLTSKRKLGLIYFPADTLKNSVIDYFKETAGLFGFTTAYGSGYDYVNTYAVTKAFNQINHEVDLFYVAPLWGLESNKLSGFFERLNQIRKPGFISEGSLILEKGAFATADYYAVISQARFFAERTRQVIEGATPGSLPVVFNPDFLMAVNGQTAQTCGFPIPENISAFYYVTDTKPSETDAVYTLSDALFLGKQQQPNLLADLDFLNAAEGETERLQRVFYPRLSVTGTYRYLDDNNTYNTYNYYKNNQAALSLGLRQELFSLENRRKIASSRIEQSLKEADYKQQQVAYEHSLSKTYLECLRFEQLRKNSVNYRKIIDYYLQLTKAVNMLGNNKTIEIARLENRRAAINKELLDINGQLKNYRVGFNALLNLPGDNAFVLDESGFSEKDLFDREGSIIDLIKPVKLQKKHMKELLALAYEQHPLLHLASGNIALGKARLNEVAAGSYPSLRLDADLTYADRLEKTLTLDEKHSTWSIGGTLEIPLFDGGERGKKKAKLKHEISAFEYKKDAAALMIMEDVRSAYNTLVSKAFSITAAYRARTYAATARDEITSSYTSGKASLTDFLIILDEADKADRMFINARFSYFKAIIALYYSLGKPASENYSNGLEELHTILEY